MADKPNPEIVESALQEIRDRSYSGRHPELGKMVNCPFCSLRHRKNERVCQQKFATTEDGVVYGELKPPEHMTEPTKNQVLGARMFKHRRARPRNKPKKPMHHWLRLTYEAMVKKGLPQHKET